MKTLIVAALVLSATSMVWAGPDIEIANAEFNFGRTAQHVQVAHSFWIKSTGDEPLRILEIKPGCGCTQAPIGDSVVAPGDSTQLEILFSTKSYRGHVAKRPYLVTNIGEDRYYVRITSELLPDPSTAMPVALNPYVLDVSQFREKPRLKAKFLIENKSDRDYTIELVDYSQDYFSVDLPTVVKAGESVTGLVTVHKELVKTEFERSLTFQINDDVNSRYTLPVKRWYRVKAAD